MAGLGNVPVRMDLALDLVNCNRLLDFQPNDLTVTVEAGMTLDALHSLLAQGQKYLPLEAPHSDTATVGGILSTNFTGPRRFAYGLPRDWLIGISVVSAGGAESKAGGKVVKNVTGYDLNKLYTGALGTLGVIVEASFKLTPVPRHSRALIACFNPARVTAGTPVGAAQALVNQGRSPQGITVLDHRAARRISVPIIQDMMRGTGPRPMVGLGILRRPGRRSGPTTHVRPAQTSWARWALEKWSNLGRPTPALSWRKPPHWVGKWKRRRICQSNSTSLLPLSRRWCWRGPNPGPWALRRAIIADPGFGALKLLWWPDTDQYQPEPIARPDETALAEIIETVRDLTHQAGGTAVVEQCPLPVKSPD